MGLGFQEILMPFLYFRDSETTFDGIHRLGTSMYIAYRFKPRSPLGHYHVYSLSIQTTFRQADLLIHKAPSSCNFEM